MSYVYILSEDWREDGERRQLYTVGFYKPDGKFEGDNDFNNKGDAADRVNYLNGGVDSATAFAVRRFCDAVYEHGLGVRLDR